MSENQLDDRLARAIDRAVEMLLVAQRFINENPVIQEQTTFYDEAECDGSCVAEDLGHAVDEIRYAMESRAAIAKAGA